MLPCPEVGDNGSEPGADSDRATLSMAEVDATESRHCWPADAPLLLAVLAGLDAALPPGESADWKLEGVSGVASEKGRCCCSPALGFASGRTTDVRAGVESGETSSSATLTAGAAAP